MKKRNRSKINGIYEAAVIFVSNKTRAIAKKFARLMRKAKVVCVGILSKRVPYPAPGHRVFCRHHPLPPCFFSRFSFGLLNVLHTICTATYICACIISAVLMCSSCKSAKTVEHNETKTSDITTVQTMDRGITTIYSRYISAILDDLSLRNVTIRVTDFKEDGRGRVTAKRVTEISADSVGTGKAQVRRREGAERSDSVAAFVTSSTTIAAETAQKTKEQPQKASGWRAAQILCAIIVLVLVVVLALRVWRSKGNFFVKIIKWLFF